ncbi:MAG: hypothetical protein L0Y74_02505, partial [candidate division Zixibacteria bacterium]|nr:hypothetical protein [candidate division Zixibacteria bacterium]
KEKARRRKEESKITEPLVRRSRIMPPSNPAPGAQIIHVVYGGAKIIEQKTDGLKLQTEVKVAAKETREKSREPENKVAVEKLGKKAEEKPETTTDPAPKIKRKKNRAAVDENKGREPGLKKPKARNAEKIPDKKAAEKKIRKPEFKNKTKPKMAKKIREKVAAFKLKSEQILKAWRKEKKKKEKKNGTKAVREKVKRPQADKKITAEKQGKKVQKRRADMKVKELRAKPRQASCSLVFKKIRSPEIVRRVRPAARILPARRRLRRGEILFKLGF